MLKTIITLEIDHEKPLPDILDKAAGRIYTLDGVRDVTARLTCGNMVTVLDDLARAYRTLGGLDVAHDPALRLAEKLVEAEKG